MANDAAREAAAALAPDMLTELVDKVPLPPSAGEDLLAADLEAQRVAAEPTVVPSGPTAEAVTAPTAEQTAQEEEVSFDFEPQLTDELRELLEEPDFDDDASLEVEAEAEESDEYVDEATAKKLRALEKKVQWQEQQLVRANRKKWVTENLKAYPLLRQYAQDEVEKIDATSRRGFAREAARLNDRFEKIAAPLIADIKKAKESVFAEATVEAKQEVKAAWGEPQIGPSNVAVAASEQASDLAAARKTGQLHLVINKLFKQAGVGQ